MPSALINNAPPAELHQDRSREKMAMTTQSRGSNTAVCPTDDDALPKAEQKAYKKAHKQSWDYIWRTGIAGGFAGSAVSEILLKVRDKY